MFKHIRILFILFIIGLSQKGFSTTITSANAGGNWSVGTTWVGNTVPSNSDDVIINSNVSVNANYTCGSLVINSGKTLTINSGFTLTINYNLYATAVLNSGTLTFQNGGNNKLSIQTNNYISSAFTNSGTFASGTGTFEIKGSSNTLSVSGTCAFYNVSCDNVQQMDFGNNCTFNGSGLVTFSNANQTTVSGTLSFTNVTCTNIATMQFSGSSTTINGTLRLNNSTVTGGYPTYASAATLELNTTININGNDYDWPTGNGNNVPPNVSIVGGNVQLQNGNRYIKKTLSVLSGAIFNGGSACFTLPSTFTSITNIGTITLGGIDVLNGATWNVNANYTISTLQIENGGIVNANSYTLTMNAAINNCNSVNGIMEVKTGGTFNSGSGNVTFIPPYYMPVTGAITFNNISVQGSNTINIPTTGAITVNGNLNIASGSTVNNPGYINFPTTSSVTNNGTQSGTLVPTSVPVVTVASGNSGGGSIAASRWTVLSPTVYNVTSNITFTGTPKIVTIQSGAEMVLGNYTITCDSVYLYGKVTITNSAGLSGTFGSAAIVIASGSTIQYSANSGSQTITSSTNYPNLQLSGNATKLFGASTYNISGDLTYTGTTPTFAAGNTINFNGTTQNITGAPFVNLTCSNSGTKTLTSTANVTGIVTVSGSAVLASGGNLVLVSNSTGTAAVASLSGSADITGSVVAQRYIPADGRKWRFISSPVSGTTFASSWQNQIHITGPGTGGSLGTTNSNGFDWTQSASPGVYTYNENLTGSMNNRWVTIPNTSTTIISGKGYRVFVRGDRALQGNTLLNGSNYTPLAVTMAATSTLNKGQINVSLTCSNGCGASDGWNLVGNPYPSAIDWNNSSWVSARSGNIGSTIYVFNPYNNQWSSWNSLAGGVNQGSNIIGSGQAFFVKISGTATLSFQESYKSTNLSTGLFGKTSSTFSNNLHVQLNDTLMLDETVVYFNNTATKNVEEPYDGVKPSVSGNSISSYTSVNNTPLMFNGIPSPATTTTDTVYLYTAFYSVTKSFNLTFKGVSSFTNNIFLYLYDKYTSSILLLNDTAQYAFSTSATDSASYSSNRFSIIFANGTSLPVSLTSFTAAKTNDEKVNLKWTTSSEINSHYFIVEKSSNGLDFSELDNIKSAGNSSKVNQYTTTDNKPFNGVNYYRLKQVDMDGSYTYSNVVAINFAYQVHSSISIFPIPAKEELTISFKDNNQSFASIEIIDILGKKMFHEGLKFESQNSSYTVNISSLTDGIYFFSILYDDGTSEKIKFLKK